MSSVASRRADARARLDMESDFVVADGNVRFRQSFETIEDTETFSRAPDEVVEAARRLLTIDVARGLSAIVHDTIVVTIGCSRIPLYVCSRFRALSAVSLTCLLIPSMLPKGLSFTTFKLSASPADRAPEPHFVPPAHHSYTLKVTPRTEALQHHREDTW